MSADNKAVHFVAGAISGTVGGIVTCPLDVAKTRLQSSLIETYSSSAPQNFGVYKSLQNQNNLQRLRCMSTVACSAQQQYHGSTGFIKCIRHIVATEGYRALFKGLVPTLVGVAPSRAIQFTSYEHSSAGFVCTTATNPIWMIKTRLQLNNKSGSSSTTVQCIRSIYSQHGIRGFYKGLVASYFGIVETSIYFVIYEVMKAQIVENRKRRHLENASQRKRNFSDGDAMVGDEDDDGETGKSDMDPQEILKYMVAAAVAKCIASTIAYPHEVARTRLREENSRYRTFFGTLATVFKEEGYRGLYRGFATQLIKHIPNTAIVFATYEAVIYLSRKNGF